MKRTLLLALFALPFLGNAQFFENFDAGTTAPAGWTVINGGDTATFIFGEGAPGSAFSQPNAAQINYSTAAHDDYLVTPAITVTAGVNDKLTYFVKNQDPAYVESYEVKLSTTTATAAAFTTTLTALAEAPSAWTQFKLDLSQYVGQTVYVGFHATSTDKFRLLFDDVRSFGTDPALVAPNCASLVAPANAATGISNSAATVSWAAPAAGAAVEYYEVFYGTSPNPTTRLNAFPASVTSAVLPSLSPATQYYWKVVAKNQAGDAVSCSEYSFTTDSTVFCTTSPNGSYGALVPSTCDGVTAVTRTTAWAGEYSTVSVVAGRTYKFQVLLQPSYFITIASNDTTPVGLASGVGTVNYTATTTGTLRFYSHTNTSCGTGTASTSHTRSVICMGTLAVSDAQKAEASVYPNPFHDVLNISDVKGVKSISVNDIAGRQVKELAPASELNLSSLKAGLYIVNLKMEDGKVRSIKVIKK